MHKLLIIMAFGLLFIQCQKEEDLGSPEIYNFKTTINTDYNADTISIGDTIWFDSKIVSFLVDSATNKSIYFGNARININMLVRAWNVENQTFESKYCNFDFKKNYSSFISQTSKATMVGLYYYADAGKYLLKFGVIFNKSGIYSIDADYLKFKSYYNNNIVYFGGGYMQFYNTDNKYREAYLSAEITAENQNIHLYNELSDEDKASFQVVNDDNQSKYFFIKVNE